MRLRCEVQGERNHNQVGAWRAVCCTAILQVDVHGVCCVSRPHGHAHGHTECHTHTVSYTYCIIHNPHTAQTKPSEATQKLLRSYLLRSSHLFTAPRSAHSTSALVRSASF